MKKTISLILIYLGLFVGAYNFNENSIPQQTNLGGFRAFVSEQIGDTPINGHILQTNGSTSTWVATSTLGISAADEKVKLSASDPTAGYLDAKLNEGVTGVRASGSAGFHIKGSGGTTAALFGAGGGNNATFYDGVKLDSQTADRILSTDSSKNITALDTATYPSLTELSYVKGVTSAIQTQLNSKIDSSALTPYAKLDGTNQPFTGDINISKTTPEFKLTDTSSTRYSRLVRSATDDSLILYNEVVQPASLKYAVNFSGGNSNYITMGTASSLKLTGALSYAVWIKGNGSNNYGGIIGRGSGATGSAANVASILFFHSTTGRLRFDLSNGTSQLNLFTPTGTSYDDNSWHFVVVTWDGSTTTDKVKIYVDNVEVAAGTAVGTTITANPSLDNFFKIGKLNVTGNLYSFAGAIDVPVVFSKELSPSEISTMWNGGLGLRPSTAVAPYNDANFVDGWNFDEGTGTTANSVKIGGVSGTLTSSPTWVTGFSFPETYIELPAITIKDGVSTNEGGVITIGDSLKTPGVVLDGQTVKLNIGGTTKVTLGSSGDATFVGRLLSPNGTAALPSLTATSDPDTGIYFSGANDLLFTTSGVARMSFNSVGTAAFIPNGTQTLNVSSTGVGIGGLYSGYSGQFNVQNTSSATAKITSVIKAIASQTSNLTEWQNSAGSVVANVTVSGGAVFNEQGNDADFRVEGDTDVNNFFSDASTDRIGIGTSTPAVKLDVNGAIKSNGVIKLTAYTVATLPTGARGDTAYVTDALAPTYLTAVVGGGAIVTPVFYDGTNWVAH